MTSVRRQLADLLSAALPEWDVRPTAQAVDGLEGPTLLVLTGEVNPGPTRGLNTWTMRVRLLTHLTDPDQVDDDLDDLLPQLLKAIESLDPITWSNAERGIQDDTYHAYTVTVSVPARKD